MGRWLLTTAVILFFLAALTPQVGWSAEKPPDMGAGRLALVLDGNVCGFLKSATGGMARAEISMEDQGRKRLGLPKYEDITIQVGMDACKGLYDWIADALKRTYKQKSGAIVAVDSNNNEISRIEFIKALVFEIGFPAFDTASKERAYLTLKLSPETTKRKKGGGGKVTVGGPSAQKAWFPSYFRFEISGLDTSKVNKIDAFTVKLPGSGKLLVPNLSFTLAESQADSIYNWHEDFVIKGNNSDSKEKTGLLVWRTPDGQKELGRLEIKNIGIFRLGAEEMAAGADAIKRVKVDVYVERMEFSVK